MPKQHAPRGPMKRQNQGDPMEGAHPMKVRWEVRCSATNRAGNQCGKEAIPGGHVCRMHGGAAPQVQGAAMERLKAMQPKALATIDMLMDASEFPTVQLQASKAVIDWTEGRAKESKTIELVASITAMSDDELRAHALALIEAADARS